MTTSVMHRVLLPIRLSRLLKKATPLRSGRQAVPGTRRTSPQGEHGSLVIFADRFTKTEPNDKGESVEHAITFMKSYTVFNVEQIEKLPAHFYAQPVNLLPLSDRIEHADHFVTATGAALHHGGNQAFCVPSRDTIQLPPFPECMNIHEAARSPFRQVTTN